MADCAIIFDVDGVLLELTRAEEDLFFEPFGKFGAYEFSRDWNSYAIRNDEDILAELVQRLNLPKFQAIEIKNAYLQLLESKLATGEIASPIIYGARDLLDRFSKRAALGIATANFRSAALFRLKNAGLWHYVSDHAHGADGGGPKREILARALLSLNVPKSRIIYIGDNLNDVEAGLKNGLHFIGFSENADRLKTLAQAGATHLSSDHHKTAALIEQILNI